jgi:hypothetical protein
MIRKFMSAKLWKPAPAFQSFDKLGFLNSIALNIKTASQFCPNPQRKPVNLIDAILLSQRPELTERYGSETHPNSPPLPIQLGAPQHCASPCALPAR